MIALDACRALVAAYRQGLESGGSVDWSDVDRAHELALAALADQPLNAADEPGSVREAARRGFALDGADAQALEAALQFTERERDAAYKARDVARREARLAKAQAETPAGTGGDLVLDWTRTPIGWVANAGFNLRVELDGMRACRWTITTNDEAKSRVVEMAAGTVGELPDFDADALPPALTREEARAVMAKVLLDGRKAAEAALRGVFLGDGQLMRLIGARQ